MDRLRLATTFVLHCFFSCRFPLNMFIQTFRLWELSLSRIESFLSHPVLLRCWLPLLNLAGQSKLLTFQFICPCLVFSVYFYMVVWCLFRFLWNCEFLKRTTENKRNRILGMSEAQLEVVRVGSFSLLHI